jgi:putative phosphoribosyl transferase
MQGSAMTSSGTAVAIDADGVRLEGDLVMPEGACGVVAFAHGSGSSRRSPRNRLVAARLQQAQLATLLFDLLEPGEEEIDMRTAELRFDIPLLSRRLIAAVDWLSRQQATSELALGCFGASTGAAAALVAAAQRPERVRAVVSRGGRPDLAGGELERVRAPTLLIVGGDDPVVIDLNRKARARMRSETRLEIIPGASHLFEEPGTLDKVADLAAEWFGRGLLMKERA